MDPNDDIIILSYEPTGQGLGSVVEGFYSLCSCRVVRNSQPHHENMTSLWWRIRRMIRLVDDGRWAHLCLLHSTFPGSPDPDACWIKIFTGHLGHCLNKAWLSDLSARSVSVISVREHTPSSRFVRRPRAQQNTSLLVTTSNSSMVRLFPVALAVIDDSFTFQT